MFFEHLAGVPEVGNEDVAVQPEEMDAMNLEQMEGFFLWVGGAYFCHLVSEAAPPVPQGEGVGVGRGPCRDEEVWVRKWVPQGWGVGGVPVSDDEVPRLSQPLKQEIKTLCTSSIRQANITNLH